MGLYLCVFSADDSDSELDGIEVGSYDDFHQFRSAVSTLEPAWGDRFPVLMHHSDSDGEWSSGDCRALLGELEDISTELRAAPARMPDAGGWPLDVMRKLGAIPDNACESFIDVDGEPLVRRLQDLAGLAVREDRPISFM